MTWGLTPGRYGIDCKEILGCCLGATQTNSNEPIHRAHGRQLDVYTCIISILMVAMLLLHPIKVLMSIKSKLAVIEGNSSLSCLAPLKMLTYGTATNSH